MVDCTEVLVVFSNACKFGWRDGAVSSKPEDFAGTMLIRHEHITFITYIFHVHIDVT